MTRPGLMPRLRWTKAEIERRFDDCDRLLDREGILIIRRKKTVRIPEETPERTKFRDSNCGREEIPSRHKRGSLPSCLLDGIPAQSALFRSKSQASRDSLHNRALP
jgi:hypothetical protein